MAGAIFPSLDPDAYEPHLLHGADRVWPETNCYVDLWIEVLAAMGAEPRALLGFTAAMDFEGDQFTFFKPPLEDLEVLYGIRVGELAIYDRVEQHITVQLARGRLSIVEVDSFYLPDTKGVSYHNAHGKTTVAPNRIDIAGRRMEYFHNGGYFVLEGEDFDGIFLGSGDPARPFLPYTEFAKLPETAVGEDALRARAADLLHRRIGQRPAANPVREFQARIAEQAESLVGRPFDAFHQYAFNTLRQLGANFELMADHLIWLDGDNVSQQAVAAASAIAQTAKATQFQLARSVMKKSVDRLVGAINPAVDAYDLLFDELGRR
ncbi:MAG: DUF1839 family protein [Caulobacteraceae bacterium]